MTREEALQAIIDAVDPLDEFSEDTVIADCDDLDSLGLFNVVLYLNSIGLSPSLTDLAAMKTVGDIVDLVLTKN